MITPPKRSGVILLALLAALGAIPLFSQEAPKRGDIVTLTFPEPFFKATKGSWATKSVFQATIEPVAKGVRISGHDAWDPPHRLESYEITRVQYDQRSNSTDLDLQGGEYRNLTFRLHFLGTLGEVARSLPAISVPGNADGPDAQRYRASIQAGIMSKVFVDELSSIPDSGRIALMELVNPDRHLVLSGTVGLAQFKDKKWIELGIGSGDSVYNTLKLNQSQRLALAVSQRALKLLKAALPYATQASLAGIKLTADIYSRSFANEYEEPGREHLEMYVPSDQLKAFAAADATSQQLINASTVLLNGDRVAVNLTQ
jgi:hypothetical protein